MTRAALWTGITLLLAAIVAFSVPAHAAKARSPKPSRTPRAMATPRATATPRVTATPRPSAGATPLVTADDLARLRDRRLLFPVPDVSPATVRDTFVDARGGRAHEALDIAAARRAPVVAVDDGVIAKLFASVPGGLTLYLFDDERRFAYYYAHLDAYADDVAEGKRVRRGQVVGYVGSTGNAAVDAPHLHFAIFKLEAEPRWWVGTPIDPHPFVVGAPAPSPLASPVQHR